MDYDPKNPPVARTHQEAQKFVGLLWAENIGLRRAIRAGRWVTAVMSLTIGGLLVALFW